MRIGRESDNLAVKFGIQLIGGAEIVLGQTGLCASHDGFKACDVLSGHMALQIANGECFENGAAAIERPQFPRVDAFENVSAMADGFEDAILLQLSKRFAHRGSADVELL